MSTIRQLAKAAGVSPSTVSMALHNHPRISKQTRKRIRELAEIYGYRVQPKSEQRIRGQRGTVGYIIPSAHSPFYSRILEGILVAASAESYHIAIMQTFGNLDYLCLAISALLEQQVDGILISSALLPAIPADVLLELASSNIPAVGIGFTLTSRPLDHVYTDEERLAQLALDYLYSLGHRRLGYIGATIDNLRARTLEKYARRYGMDCLLIEAERPELAHEILLKRFHHHPLPTVFIGHDDRNAAHVIHYAQQQGLQVPGDLSVLGCGNYFLARDVELTSIEQFPEEIGRRALSLLLQCMQPRTRQEKTDAQTILIEPQLVIRQSCAPPRHSPRHHATPPVTPPVDHEISPAVARLLPWCDPPRGKRELMALLGMHDVNHFRQAYIDQALQRGLVARTIPDKPNSCKQQYRVTELGRRWLQEQASPDKSHSLSSASSVKLVV
ncbi:MAG: LacI family DNA-binding transcriptional regulator [Armatimonadota bacterium]